MGQVWGRFHAVISFPPLLCICSNAGWARSSIRWESLKFPSVKTPACKGKSSQHRHLYPCANLCVNKGSFPESKHKFLGGILSRQPSSTCLGTCIKTNTAVERSLTCYVVAWSTQFSSHLKEDRRHNNKNKAEIRAISLSALLSRKMGLLEKAPAINSSRIPLSGQKLPSERKMFLHLTSRYPSFLHFIYVRHLTTLPYGNCSFVSRQAKPSYRICSIDLLSRSNQDIGNTRYDSAH